MFKWLRKKIVKGFIKDFVQDLKEFDVKGQVINYIKANEEELIEDIEEKIKACVEKAISKIIAKYAHKAQ
jgi:NTP pyrophosphatase (non-canonical NTP hydrolase)